MRPTCSADLNHVPQNPTPNQLSKSHVASKSVLGDQMIFPSFWADLSPWLEELFQVYQAGHAHF